MSHNVPRVVVITRATPFDLVVARHGTVQQADFFLQSRGQSLAELRLGHLRQQRAIQAISAAIPVEWRRANVVRNELDRFLFAPEDIVVAVGQDGLVANASKYLSGQPVIGVNPAPSDYAGVLVPHPADAAADLLRDVARERHSVQSRTMVEAEVDGGFRLRALNELFIGHITHQSARYRLSFEDREERHSSSGVIVATGTGCTGWARSIHRQRRCSFCLLEPEDAELLFFVREAFPSPATGCDVVHGVVYDSIEITSEMNDGGVIFGDGIESDRIEFGWGKTARISRADQSLRLVV